jgi:hypothetical protein
MDRLIKRHYKRTTIKYCINEQDLPARFNSKNSLQNYDYMVIYRK